ncbi:MAG: inorganic pyrophosphatase, partial [Halobacteria archaeon]|nr:inorganic pyrophosphatase [Halobacteria archaeon]
FETYKALEPGKETETQGFKDKEAALDAIEHSIDLYKSEFGE